KWVWLATQMRARSETSGTYWRRLKWPRPVSNRRSWSRPRTCHMLQRKNGLIQGSWISVTPSPMRTVSYHSWGPIRWSKISVLENNGATRVAGQRDAVSWLDIRIGRKPREQRQIVDTHGHAFEAALIDNV